VIPYAFGRASADALTEQGYTLEWHGYAMPHSVCPQEIRDIEQWLTQRLSE
jgi:phospholipase/carboxylesterase